MFIVYYGYFSPDNCGGEYLTHQVKTFNTQQYVLQFHKEFQETLHKECTHVYFRVFEGKELTLQPIKVVTEYQLK